jgi:putative polyketide hydroxylase
MDSDYHTPVLVVGGAVVGLSAALFLSWQGVQPLLVERHASALLHPRARGVNPRTVELYRSVGLEKTIFAARSLTADFSRKMMVRAETLAGPERFSAPLTDEAPEITDEVTPCRWCAIDQNRLEEILAARAKELGADVRYSTQLLSFEQHADEVIAVVREMATGAERTVRAQYLVAADGYHSSIRDLLGVETDGPGTLMQTLSVVFKADLSGPLRGRDLGLGYFDRPETGTLLIPLDGSRWVFYTPYHPERGETVESFDDSRCVEAIRAAVGMPQLDVENIEVQLPASGTKVLGFEVASQVAERFRDGRVFLAGDAAHTMVPTGAFGASTGIQDVHNLAWKLAAVIKGAAASELLDTYEVERQAIARFTAEQAMTHLRRRTGQAKHGTAMGYAATILGYRYRSDAVVTEEDHGGPPALDPRTLGRPGTRAPHLVLELKDERLSTLDLFGQRFVLLTGSDGTTWRRAAEPVGQRLGVDLAVYQVGESGQDDALVDVDGRWSDAYGVSSAGAVLVRPDGFVAWRSQAPEEHPKRVLEEVLARVLARNLPSRS